MSTSLQTHNLEQHRIQHDTNNAEYILSPYPHNVANQAGSINSIPAELTIDTEAKDNTSRFT